MEAGGWRRLSPAPLDVWVQVREVPFVGNVRVADHRDMPGVPVGWIQGVGLRAACDF